MIDRKRLSEEPIGLRGTAKRAHGNVNKLVVPFYLMGLKTVLITR